jgi:hypothetical protein
MECARLLQILLKVANANPLRFGRGGSNDINEAGDSANEQNMQSRCMESDQPRDLWARLPQLRLQLVKSSLPRLKLSQEITKVNTGRRNPFVFW